MAKTTFLKNQAQFRSRNAKRMLEALIVAGVRLSEIQEAVGCSRWMITLWLQQRCAPKQSSYAAIKKAYLKYRPYEIPTTARMVKFLQSRVDLVKAIGCSETTRKNWRHGLCWPQARYRTKLVELYKQHRRQAEKDRKAAA